MIGTVISHYRILEKLGEGGMGVVYKAHDTRLERDVALKFLPQYLSSDRNEKERFYQEARAAAALMHQNIAVIHEIGEHEGQLYLAMELVEGQTLKKLIEHSEPASIKKDLDIAIQICEGLTAAHEKSVVHRDIKSDNIIITPKGQAKIMDFGLAKLKGATKLTEASSTLGTAAYMSPEQAQGEDVDNRSDIFSFGVVLYEMLTSKLPWRAEHQAALMYSLINEEPQPIARFNERVTPELERIVAKALAKDRDDRYQHAEDLLADLRRERKNIEYAKGGRATTTVNVPEPPGSQVKKKIPALAGAAVVIGIIAVLFLVFKPFGIQRAPDQAAAIDRKSIAVLPFRNLSENKEDEYFSDGMTEDIITQLSKIGDLKVISRTSIMQYKGAAKSLREIGKELNVATVLEGSVRRSGNRIRIVGQLIDARTDDHLWAETYDRDMKDIFAVQSDVAQKIGGALQAKLSDSERASIEKKPTDNLEAYGYYTRGRQYYYLYHQQDNDRAVELFKKALALDPRYARAFAGLGDCYGQRALKFGFSGNWIDSGLAASQKAIAIDPTLAEAYKALGVCYSAKGYINRALDANYKAVERNPNYTPAVGNIAILNYLRGDLVEAFRWAVKDASLAASEPFTFLERGQIYLFLTEDSHAEQWYKKALDLQPDFLFAALGLSNLSIDRGDMQKAREYAQQCLSNEPDDASSLNVMGNVELFSKNYGSARVFFGKGLNRSVRLGDFCYRANSTGLGFCLTKLGNREEGLKLLSESRSRHEANIKQGSEYAVVRYELATINAVEGRRAEALMWLQKAMDLGWRDYRYAQRDPMLESLHGDAHFLQMMADMKAKVEDQRKLVQEMEQQ